MLSSIISSAFRMRVATILATALSLLLSPLSQAHDLAPQPAPAFTHRHAGEWLNSPPLTLEQLRGQVVLVDFWTFGCWNCYRTLPWLNTLHERYGSQGLAIVGVHSPEFEHEKDPAKLAAKVREYGLKYPVMIDNDFSYWRALGNRFWPAFYLVDKTGRLRAHFVGETHVGDRQAREIEARIEALLAEPAG